MPARISSMELSDPAAPSSSPSINDLTSRRRSARVKQPPVPYWSSGEKRKRDILSEQDLDSEEESEPDGSDSGPDEEELKERRRKAPKAKNASNRPVSKKPKTVASMTTKLPVRSATNGFKKPAKPKKSRARPSAAVLDEEGGLYGK